MWCVPERKRMPYFIYDVQYSMHLHYFWQQDKWVCKGCALCRHGITKLLSKLCSEFINKKVLAKDSIRVNDTKLIFIQIYEIIPKIRTPLLWWTFFKFLNKNRWCNLWCNHPEIVKKKKAEILGRKERVLLINFKKMTMIKNWLKKSWYL